MANAINQTKSLEIMTKTKATYIYTVTLPNTLSHNIELPQY